HLQKDNPFTGEIGFLEGDIDKRCKLLPAGEASADHKRGRGGGRTEKVYLPGSAASILSYIGNLAISKVLIFARIGLWEIKNVCPAIAGTDASKQNEKPTLNKSFIYIE
ncbi:MAG: hypothetical protein AAFP19_15615, partial [Bacteroidota bacterium]